MRWWWVPDTVPLALFFTATSCQKMQHLQKGMHPFFSLVQFTAANIEFYLIGEKVQQISTGSIKRMIKLLRFLTYRMKAAAREFEPWPVEIRFCKEASGTVTTRITGFSILLESVFKSPNSKGHHPSRVSSCCREASFYSLFLLHFVNLSDGRKS
ncbi:uncharacterized protein LOC126611104 isoform X1 [Malus sylvestris]|uniref:uncharacterized protein LOC126611104 isoform X1 n=1 Tax=Malus sylvestris TaxID=3752 RepID=UPI0021ACD4B8|nr:uncharacterized protein LOC126611104 isoform X1 [Malus sylvestris]